MIKRIIAILFIILVAVGILYGVRANRTDQPASNKLQVSASFYPLYFFASEIGGENAAVDTIVPSGTEPHDFEPSARDITKATQSKLLILNGAGLEPWGESLIQERKKTNGTIVVVTDSLALIESQETHEEEEAAGEILEEHALDPHVWLSPRLAKDIVTKIRVGYQQADPNNASIYESNAKILTEKLFELDKKYQTGLASCTTRDFITSHTAFAYIAQEYDLNQISISGLLPEDEPSAQELAAVADFAREHNVQYIFFETLVSPKLSQTIAEEVGAQTLVLDPLEGISDDEIAQGKNYFTVMEQNLTNLKVALQCQ